MRTNSARCAAGFALVTLAAFPAAAQEPPAPAAASAPATPASAAPVIPVPQLNTAPPAMAPLPSPGAPYSPYASSAAPAGLPVLPSEAAAQFKRKKQLILAGAILFGLAYYGALSGSSAAISRGGANSREYIPGLIPIVGPFVTAGLRADPNRNTFVNQPSGDFVGMGIYLALGVVQSVGAGIFIAGLRMPTGRAPEPCTEQESARRPCSPVRVSFQPVVSPTFAGGGLTGVF